MKSAVERWRDWEQFSALPGIVKIYKDYEKEEFNMTLEDQRKDRDYLYGRLLAVADRIESVARYKQGAAKEDARATNAIRYMATFAQHPFRTWHMLFTQQLNPYIQQLKGAGWYLNQIEAIMTLFKEGEYESDSPSGKFLRFFCAKTNIAPKANKQYKMEAKKMNLKNKIDFAVVFTKKAILTATRSTATVRVDYDGCGEVSDVCLKRKLRNRLQDLGEAIFTVG